MATIYAKNKITGKFEKIGPAANATDSTLTLQGSPADAKATGDAINNIQEQIDNLAIEGGGTSSDAVLYTAQTLTNSQKTQARTNIGAMSADTVIPTVPKNISAFTNDKGYLTAVPSEYVTETELTAKGYLTSYTETDPTVPSWAKASTKPKYTASEVGADASGTASSAVSSHNTSTTAHADIREQISQLSSEIVDIKSLLIDGNEVAY